MSKVDVCFKKSEQNHAHVSDGKNAVHMGSLCYRCLDMYIHTYIRMYVRILCHDHMNVLQKSPSGMRRYVTVQHYSFNIIVAEIVVLACVRTYVCTVGSPSKGRAETIAFFLLYGNVLNSESVTKPCYKQA